MTRKIIFLLILTFTFAACTSGNEISREEMVAGTIEALVEQELESTQSQVPATLTPTASATKPPTSTPTNTNSPTPEPTSTPKLRDSYPAEGYGPDNFPKNINPLTGLLVDDLKTLDRRPISVKISNYPMGIRPQWGLSSADHVYEYYHEAGLTRFNAIFYGSDVDQFGPIRSGRLSDVDIINMYKAFFAFGSADYRVREVLYSSSFANRLSTATDYPCPPNSLHPLCRIDQEHWNHLVGSTEMLHEHFEDAGVSNGRQVLDGFFFNPELPKSGKPGENILVRFSQGSYHKWEYKPSDGKYYRYEDTEVANLGQEQFSLSKDRLNNEPLTTDNLVILIAEYDYYSVNPEIVEINFSGSGHAYVFREGQVFYVNWDRATKDALFRFSFEDGTPLPLKPGNTWFVVVGRTSEVLEENDNWSFDFNIP